MFNKFFSFLIAAAVSVSASIASISTASAEVKDIADKLVQRIPQLKHIDEVSPTPMPGLYEVRIGTDIFYADAEGNYLIQGELIDVRAQRNLTEDRVNALTAIDFTKLPFEDAITLVRGNGERQMAVFEDPNCGFCKRFEREMEKVNNVTVHLFLYPILSRDSVEKSRNIWCAKDKAAAWSDYMLRDLPPEDASCDVDALERNLALGRKHKITGTPTIIFSSNRRVPGMIPSAEVEKQLASQ